jgi:hypothetical protein
MEPIRVNGRDLDSDTLTWLRDKAKEIGMTRNRLATLLCEKWDWRNIGGKLKLMAARVFLNRLGSRDVLVLPPARTKARIVRKQWPEVSPLDLSCSLKSLSGLRLERVSVKTPERSGLWNALVSQEHYLGYSPLTGAQMRYLIVSDQGVLGALGLQASALHLQARDQWIGWDAAACELGRHQIVNNTRFLIRPGVRVPHLASKVLSLMARQLPQDWQEVYGYAPVLLETFVEHGRFKGTSYRAANWRHIGKTQGRGRQDHAHDAVLAVKDIYVYPLVSDARHRLGGQDVDMPIKPMNKDWAETEFESILFSDLRMKKRVYELARAFHAQPTANVPQACGSRAGAKAAYRFFAHEEVTMKRLLDAHCSATIKRAASETVVLAVQDTTGVNYSGHKANDELGDIGTLGGQTRGLWLHSTLTFTPTGLPLGLIDAQTWIRKPQDHGKSATRRDRSIEEKESVKWLRSYTAVIEAQRQTPGVRWVSVGDREADIYELFDLARREGEHAPGLLVRAVQDRAVEGEHCRLWQTMESEPVSGAVEIVVPRKSGQPTRKAKLAIRYRAIELKAPRGSNGTLKVWAIHAREIEPPNGVQSLCWLLLTTIPVLNMDGAIAQLAWYAKRWQIEVFHRTLKSGCRIEKHQFETRKELESCMALDMVVAWRIMWLTKQSREKPDIDCTVDFEADEWKAVWCVCNQTTQLPAVTPTLRTIVRMVASLGGFLGRAGDKEPGAQTLWRGIQRMKDIVVGYRLFSGLSEDSICVQPVYG